MDVEFIRNLGATDDVVLGSTIISILLRGDGGELVTSLDEELTVCVEEDSLPGTSGEAWPNICLSYYDEETGEWICQDHNLHSTGDGQLCGTTPHLTNFALLLGPGQDGSSDGWNHTIGWLSLGFASGAVLMVVLSTLVVESWYRYQRRYRKQRLRLLSRLSSSETQHVL